jgi:hypothetical protein
MLLTVLMTMVVFAAALCGLSLGALVAGRRLRKSCGDLDCVCERPCERRAGCGPEGRGAGS